MKITVIGTGYVGLASAVALAEFGHNVTCLDKDPIKISRLKAGDPVIFEDGLEELMKKNSSKLFFSDNVTEAYQDTDVAFLCVGTPENTDGSANLEYVFGAVDEAISYIDNDILLVVKSTVPIGTCDKIQEYINKSNCKYNVEVASNPEFLSQGTAVKNMLEADRVIIGTDSKEAREKMTKIYENMDSPIVFTNRCSAEMIKYASNTFLAMKISYINEIANLCELMGADVVDVATGMGMDPRIGNKFLNAGIGYGGSCFPKDTKALCFLADSYGYDLKTVGAAVAVNEYQKCRLLDKSRKYYSSLKDLTVAVLGLTFKPGTDDLREAPSVINIEKMLDEGAHVKAWDPVGIDNFKKQFANKENYTEGKIGFCTSPVDTVKDADICFIFTEWDEVKSMKPEDFSGMKKAIVLDGRNCFNVDIMKAQGIIYDSIGRK